MARGPCTFRQHDVTKALKAAVAAGFTVRGFQIDKAGNIRIHTGSGAEAGDKAEHNEWDEVYGEDQAALRQ